MPEKTVVPKKPVPKKGFSAKEQRKINFSKRKFGGMHATSEDIEVGGCDLNCYDELMQILEENTLVLHNSKANYTDAVQVVGRKCVALFRVDGQPNTILIHNQNIICDHRVFTVDHTTGQVNLVQQLELKVRFVSNLNPTMIMVSEIASGMIYFYKLREISEHMANMTNPYELHTHIKILKIRQSLCFVSMMQRTYFSDSDDEFYAVTSYNHLHRVKLHLKNPHKAVERVKLNFHNNKVLDYRQANDEFLVVLFEERLEILCAKSLNKEVKFSEFLAHPQKKLMLATGFDLVTKAAIFIQTKQGVSVCDMNIKNAIGPVLGCDEEQWEGWGQLRESMWVVLKNKQTGEVVFKEYHYQGKEIQCLDFSTSTKIISSLQHPASNTKADEIEGIYLDVNTIQLFD
ncbi:hypothetical protein FGO68_gene3115 [Halteria grandinella]|uniref:Uncharacterized protein n=1 Tax=Halteria grandinella TaxID=5974 RepID=A0A8J8P3P5_HALGN|nr:hypothetical protein FGO68_gene3115 [Halteria grandinella]